MGIYNSKLWISDLDETIAALPELDDLAGQTVLITGCTGLICSAVIDTFIRWNKTHERKIKIMAAGRNKQKAVDRFASCANEEWFCFIPYDASEAAELTAPPCDFIIHGASNASPNQIIQEPVETMLSNFLGMNYLLNYAKKNNTKRTLFISSSEVYGKKDGTQPYRTDEYGYIDLLNARNSYSVGKRATETLCASFAHEYGMDIVIVRPGHIYGPTASRTDRRVSSAWPLDVAQGKSIIMKSDGAQIRSYCYCLDSASAIVKVLLKGESLHAYNISNPGSVITIREMAEILTRYTGVELELALPNDEEKKMYNPMQNSSLDSTELLMLGWRGIFDAERGLSHTVEIIRDLLKQDPK